MKSIITPLFIAFFISNTYAHKEPIKTLKDKKEAETKRKKILKNKIKAYTVYNHKVNDGKIDYKSKTKFITLLFDKNGNNSELQVFKEGDSLDYKNVFKHDKNNNLLSNSQFSSKLKTLSKSIYFYNKKGLISKQVNYNEKNKIESKFTYKRNLEKNHILFIKYKPLDSVEYQIEYKYKGDIDNGKLIGVLKKEVDNTPLLHVENTFNNEGKRIRKKLFSADNDVLFYFEYKYFKNTNKYSNIVKKLSNDKVFTQTIYKLNAQGFTESTTVIDEDGKIISFSSYIYSNY